MLGFQFLTEGAGAVVSRSCGAGAALWEKRDTKLEPSAVENLCLLQSLGIYDVFVKKKVISLIIISNQYSMR